jgi:Fur family zinc uptake transcriptional regulator
MASPCHHHEHEHSAGLSGAALGGALDRAEAFCAGRQERLTAPRRRVLELLLSAEGPLKAYDLISAYDAGAPAKPPTVYRALEFLERIGFAHRVESLNAYVACRIEGGHAAAFLICDCCGAAAEFEPDISAQLAAADVAGYDVRSVTIEARGLCAACRKA